MRGLIAYAGSDRAVPRPGTVLKIQGRPPKLIEKLSSFNEDRALWMFRSGLDTVDIASELQCTQAAAANGLANARERERGQ